MTSNPTDEQYKQAWQQLEPVCKEVMRLIMTCPIDESSRMMLALMATASLIGTSAACIQQASDEKLPMQEVMQSIFDAVTPALIKADGGRTQ